MSLNRKTKMTSGCCQNTNYTFWIIMKRILAVSAEQRLFDLLDRNLSPYGFAIRQLSNSTKLFDVIKHYQPEIIVMDFFLNDVNGGAICHQLKLDPQTAGLPVILLSDYNDLERFKDKFGSAAVINKTELFPALTDELLHLCAPAA